MSAEGTAALDVGRLLAAVEDAPPVAAVDVVGAVLAETLGAREVAFLIADFGGDALIRLGHADPAPASRSQGRETADRMPLSGTVQAGRSPARRSRWRTATATGGASRR